MKVYKLQIDGYKGCAFSKDTKTSQQFISIDKETKEFVELSELERILKQVENESEGDKSTIDHLKHLMKIYKGNNYERKS